MKILLVGNGFNLAYSQKKDLYKNLLKEIHVLGYDMAIEHELIEPRNHRLKININNYRFKEGIIKSNPSHSEGKAWLYLNSFQHDSETTWSMIFLSEFFHKITNKKKFIQDNKTKINNIIKDYFEEHQLTVDDFMSTDFLQSKLNEYDYIITTNYDNNIEQYTSKEVIHLHGDITKNSNIKVGPFAELKTITDSIANIKEDSKNIELDIFGISMITEVHIIKYIVESGFKKVNHYIYDFRKNKDSEDICGLALQYALLSKKSDLAGWVLKNNKVAITIQKFENIYYKKTSADWLDTMGGEEVNSTFVIDGW